MRKSGIALSAWTKLLGDRGSIEQLFRYVSLNGTSVAVSFFPTLLLAVAGRLFPHDELALVSIGLAAGAFLGSVLTAVFVEAPLTIVENNGRYRVHAPHIITLLALASCVLGMLSSTGYVTAVCVAIVVAVLQLGRATAVVDARQGSELLVAIVLIVGPLLSLILATRIAAAAHIVLWGSSLIALLVRGLSEPFRRNRLAPPRAIGWTAIDAATTGVTQPYINVLLLLILGPAAAVAFRAASTVSAAVEPVITVSRLRFLRAHSVFEFVASGVLVVGAVVVAIVLDLLGVFRLIMGPAWVHVTTLVFAAALVGRGLSLLATPHFAALRRAGRASLAYWLRLSSTSAYVMLGSAGAAIGGALGAFIGMALAEVATFLAFRSAARRVTGAQPTRL